MRVLFYTIALALWALSHGATHAEPATETGTLQVRFIDPAGEAAPGVLATLQARLPDGTFKHITHGRANESGVATIPKIAPGQYRLSVNASREVLAHGELDIEVAYPENYPIYRTAMLLLASAQITGVVVTPDGQPISSMSIRVANVERAQSKSAITGKQGEFEFFGLLPGETYRYWFRSQEYVRESGESTEFVAQDGLALKIVAEEIVPGPINIRFFDAVGAPVLATGMLHSDSWSVSMGRGSGSIRSATVGRHELRVDVSDPKGSYLAKASRSVDITKDTKEIVVVLEPGLPVALDFGAETELPRLREVRVYEGSDAAPRLVGAAEVRAPSGTTYPLEGHSATVPLAPGAHDLAVVVHGFATWYGHVEVAEDQDRATPMVVDVPLKPGACFSGVIPAEVDVVRVRADQNFSVVTEVKVVDGAFRVCGMSVADTLVKFTYQDGSVLTRRYGPELFADAERQYDLPPSAELVLTVDTTGNDYLDAFHKKYTYLGYGTLSLRTPADGYRVRDLPLVPNTAMSIPVPEGEYLVLWLGITGAQKLGAVEVKGRTVKELKWSGIDGPNQAR